MAVVGTIPIRNAYGIGCVEDYVEDVDKTDVYEDVERVYEYDKNEKKTEFANMHLVTSIGCTEGCTKDEFMGPRDEYLQRRNLAHYSQRSNKKEIVAYHVIQSFDAEPNPDTAKRAHEAGIEFVKRLNEAGIGQFQAVVSTHCNTKHVHNHVLLNAYSLDGRRKLCVNITTREMMRRISDEISKEYGFPILAEIPEEDRGRSETMHEYQARNKGISWKEQMRTDIDAVIETSDTYEDFKSQMEALDYEIRELNDGTPISIAYGSHRCRLDKLGDEYTYNGILNRIARNNGIDPEQIPDEIKSKPRKIPRLYLSKVSKYDEHGRRRGMLELLLLRILNYLLNLAKLLEFENRMQEVTKVVDKAGDIRKTLDMMAKYNIVSKAEIKRKKKECGAIQRQLKYEIGTCEKTKKTIEDLLQKGDWNGEFKDQPTSHKKTRIVREKVNGKLTTRIDTDGLLDKYKDSLKNLEAELVLLYQQRAANKDDPAIGEAIKNKTTEIKAVIAEAEKATDEAWRKEHPLDKIPIPKTMGEIDPMSSKQKQALYNAMDKSSFKCKTKFNNISSTRCDALLEFLEAYASASPEEQSKMDIPAEFQDGFKPEAPTLELVQEALRHATELGRASSQELERQKKLYKDYVFIEKNVQDAEDLQEEVNSQNEQQRKEHEERTNRGEDTYNGENNKDNDEIKHTKRIKHKKVDGRGQTYIDTDGLMPDDAEALKVLEQDLVELYKIRSQSQNPGAVEQRINDKLMQIDIAVSKAEARAKRERGDEDKNPNEPKRENKQHI